MNNLIMLLKIRLFVLMLSYFISVKNNKWIFIDLMRKLKLKLKNEYLFVYDFVAEAIYSVGKFESYMNIITEK